MYLLYNAIEVGHGYEAMVPSLFLQVTVSGVVGSEFVAITATGRLSCHTDTVKLLL